MKKILLIILMLPFILEACQKEVPPTTDEDMCFLRISPFIASANIQASADNAATTRTAISSAISMVGTTVGISIFKENTFDPYELPGYSNIKAYLRSANVNAPPDYEAKWEFTPAYASSYTPTLGVFKNKAIDLYAHYPHNQDIDHTNLGAIPFTIGTTESTNFDYMYSKITGIKPSESGSVIRPELSHIMTMLNFNVGTSYAGPMKLNYIKIVASDKIFIMKGTYSAIDGSVTKSVDPDDLTDILTFQYNKTVPMYLAEPNNPPFPFVVLIPQIEVTEDDNTTITVTFNFDSDMPLFHSEGSYKFNLKDIKTKIEEAPAPLHYGFMKGYQYIFTVKVDNFVKFSGYPTINKGWETVVQDEIII